MTLRTAERMGGSDISQDASTLHIRRNVKDSLFSDLFSDKWYARELAEELLGDLDPEEVVETHPLRHILANGPICDLAISVGDRTVVHVEAQSTYNPNMPLRLLIYQTESLRLHIDRMGRSIYSGKLLGIPAPLSFVVYTGTRESPKEMRLSDAFSWDPEDLDCHLENVTRILHLGNVREGGMLWQYIRFCRINDECRERSGDDKTAYIRSLRERCMEENILVEYLQINWNEVANMYEDLWDQEYVDRMRMKESFEDGEREGLKKGEEMGLKKGERKHVKRMSEQGFSEQDISRILGIPSERVRAILHPKPM